MDKKIIVWIVLAAWGVIWILFLVRPYIKKDLLKEYAALSTRTTENKRAFIAGEELYKFIQFCSSSINPPSTYKIIGIEDYSLEHRRARYYLYPNIEQANPEFIFVYKIKNFKREGYYLFKTFTNEEYILGKI